MNKNDTKDTKEYYFFLKKDLDILKSLLNLAETQKNIIKSSKKERIDQFIYEKKVLLERLAGIDERIKKFKGKYPKINVIEGSQLMETKNEIKRIANKIVDIEKDNRKNTYNEIIMIRSLLERLKKGKHTLRRYQSNRNKIPKYINTIR